MTENGKGTDMKEYLDGKLHEECGVFGMYDRDGPDVVATAYYAL